MALFTFARRASMLVLVSGVVALQACGDDSDLLSDCAKGCPAIDACHKAGVCDPDTHRCSEPKKADGTPCDTGDLCTVASECQDGECTVIETQPDGTTCGDGELVGCFATLECIAGKCSAGYVPDGTTCEDGDSCTAASTCAEGSCTGGSDPHFWHSRFPQPDVGRFLSRSKLVIDRWSGHAWTKEVHDDESLEAATAYCASLSLDEFTSGWRLPTRIELASIVPYDAITAGYFTKGDYSESLGIGVLWTSTPYKGQAGQEWGVSPLGVVLPIDIENQDGPLTAFYVCIHAPAAPAKPACSARYTISGGTVTDNDTGLTWERTMQDVNRTWYTAKTYCDGLTLAGGGWRVPEAFELQTIVEDLRYNPAIDANVFAFAGTDPTTNDAWSASTTNADAFALRVQYGKLIPFTKDFGLRVRCVRP